MHEEWLEAAQPRSAGPMTIEALSAEFQANDAEAVRLVIADGYPPAEQVVGRRPDPRDSARAEIDDAFEWTMSLERQPARRKPDADVELAASKATPPARGRGKSGLWHQYQSEPAAPLPALTRLSAIDSASRFRSSSISRPRK